MEWFLITNPPTSPTKVLMYSATAEFWDSETGKFVDSRTDLEKLEEPRYDTGYWDGAKFYFDGANEEVSLQSGDSTDPTHWTPILPPLK